MKFIINVGSPEEMVELLAIQRVVKEMEGSIVGVNPVYQEMLAVNEIFHRPGFKFEFCLNSREAALTFGKRAAEIGLIYPHLIESNIRSVE